MVESLRWQSGNDFHEYEFAQAPMFGDAGRIELPALVVEGERIALPALSFDRRAYAGFLPLNC